MMVRRAIQIPRILLAVLFALGMLGCATTLSPESGLPAGRFSDSNDILLLPTEDFSFKFAAYLAKILASDTNLKIRAVLNLGTRDWKPYSNSPQYDPAKLKDIALPAIADLKQTYGGSVFILLTTRDINSSGGNLRFVFAESYPQDKVSVISAARMIIGSAGQQASAQVVGERLRKMTLRTIGLQFYELPRSADPKDLMYSPLMSLEALDRLEPRLSRSGPSLAQQVRFTGHTTANATLIRDALRHVVIYSEARLQCSTVESIASEVLPKGFVPPGPLGPEGNAPAIREKWIASLCGKEFPFLVVFWSAHQGGTMFNVTAFPPK